MDAGIQFAGSKAFPPGRRVFKLEKVFIKNGSTRIPLGLLQDPSVPNAKFKNKTAYATPCHSFLKA
jgi:hypothetical protein